MWEELHPPSFSIMDLLISSMMRDQVDCPAAWQPWRDDAADALSGFSYETGACSLI